jgi:hypothetical protein
MAIFSVFGFRPSARRTVAGGRPALTISLALVLAAAYSPAGAATLDPETPDYLVPDGPSATIDTDRNAEGRLQIHIRGERFNGQRLIKKVMEQLSAALSSAQGGDFDLQIEVGTLDGFNGEALHGVDLSLARRAGRIGDFALNASGAGNVAIHGDVRVARDGTRALHLETDDAGAFLRLADIYGKLTKGRMSLILEIPAVQEAILDIRELDLALEPALRRLTEAMPLLQPPTPQDVSSHPSRLHAHFALAPGKLVLKNLVFRNAMLGATMDGRIEADALDLRGVLMPFFLAEPKLAPCSPLECAGGLGFRVTGSPGSPRLLINPFADPIIRRHVLPP